MFDYFHSKHYTEYLVGVINENKLDPADLMSIQEIGVVFMRKGKEMPRKPPGESDQEFLEKLVDMLKEEIPIYV